MPASSDIYRRIEALTAHFPVRGVHLGLHPLSRTEVRRIVRSLDSVVATRASHSRSSWAREQLVILRGELTDIPTPARLVLRGAARDELIASDAIAERVDTNGLGVLDAMTEPFAEGRWGTSRIRGTEYATSPTLVAGLARALAVVVQPRLSLATTTSVRGRVDGRLHRAYARGTWKNVSLHVGSDERRWGQSPRGSLFISGNAAPFPGISIASDTAFTLPWLFRLAGPMRLTALLADLGPTQNPPHARLAGWHVSMQPWTRFELGVSVLAQTGGNGAPKATFLERVIDLFPVIDALAPQHADLQFSNKLAGGNLRLRFPELSGLDVYYELAIDDFDGRRLKSSLMDDAGHLLGARVNVGPAVVRGEWHNTSIRLYAHAQFKSGVTYQQRLIGSSLGPNARAAYLSGEWDVSPTRRLELTLADERRDPSLYTVTISGPRDRGFTYVRRTDDPDVRRSRAVVTLEEGTDYGAVRFGAGYNRAWRGGSPPRHEWLGHIILTSYWLPTF